MNRAVPLSLRSAAILSVASLGGLMMLIWPLLVQVGPEDRIDPPFLFLALMPVVIAVVDSLPRTPRGKLDRHALGATLATVRTVGSPDAPVTTNQTVNAPPS